jgi:hypothetical protein
VPLARLWTSLAELVFGRSIESGGRFSIGAFGREMFSHLIYVIKIYIFYFQCDLQRYTAIKIVGLLLFNAKRG